TAYELAIVAVMNQLTDRPNWYLDIFNEQVVADDWRKEAFAMTPLIGERAWAWCVKELRDKAVYFREKNPHIRLLDTGSYVENKLPEWALAFRIPTESRKRIYRKFQEALHSSKDDQTREDNQAKELPPPDSDLWQRAKEYLELPEHGSNTPVAALDDWMEGELKPWWNIARKLERLLRFKHPEPGTAFSYKEWKTNRHNDKAIMDIAPSHPTPPHNPYTISLPDTFRKQGLQIIVKMENIELTPQQPTYTNDAWQLDGRLNEHIAPNFIPTVHYPPWKLAAFANILGFSDPLYLSIDYHGTRSYQEIGSVATPQGRLVTFPGVLEHRFEPFQLADPTRPGHYRYIKLYLVDPHYRVCSTRNVPPQQHDWWAQVVGSDLASSAGLPRELVDGILQETDSWPMGVQEARQHRRELIKEHLWNEVTKLARMSGPGFE
ncbi:uncharacterized protein N7482_006251, partial [Penicillium canariense]